MLIGLVADVHSNAVSFKAVLSAMEEREVDMIVHAGDIVGYNPYPNETVALFKEYHIRSILGNHDRALIAGDASGFNPYAAAALTWTRNVISADNFEYISGFADREELTLQGIRAVLVHGSPRDADEYIYPEEAVPEFLIAVNADVLVLGHTHYQFKKEFPEGTIINPGSVGQPRDGNPDAAFAILDTTSGETELRRVSYDIEKVIEDMLAAALPEKLAIRLRLGR